MRRMLLAALATAGLAGPALAECPADDAVRQLADNVLANRPSQAYPGLASMADGYCAQDKLVALLAREWGPPVGYKLALTSAATQQQFGVAEPIRGTIFTRTIEMRSGAEVPAAFAAVPRIEADFLVRVKDAGVNEAGRDPVEILKHLDQVIPYIELPDLVLASGFTGPSLAAINAGARLGVLGRPIPVEATPAFAERLEKMTVTMTDDTGKQLSQSAGAAVLGQPMNAVAFLAEDLKKAGRRLEPGQYLSIAGYSAAMPMVAGRTYTLTYAGLAEAPVAVTVHAK
ncbi:MAG TPA: hypothetical protein VE684_09260 [Crenalkalicoccus sp.]|nr:hypothetical protein [Crenalkalicoccus sp.]